MRRARSLAKALTLAVAACLALTRPAVAQGTSDLFPDPLSSADMEAVLTRVGIDGDAKVAALKSFESYVGRLLELRKGAIDAYLASRPGPGERPSRDEIAKRVEERRALLRRIATIESQLFDEVRAVADASLAREIDRERARADRRRNWSASNPFLGRGTRVELADLLETSAGDATLPADTKSAINAAIASYEDQYTALARKLLDLAIEEPILMSEARATMPAPAQDENAAAADSAAWREYFRAMEEARAKVREPQSEVRDRIRTLTRTTARQITELLPEPQAAEFHSSVLERAYPSLAQRRDPVPATVEEAKELAAKGEITADALKRIEELAQQHVQSRRQLDYQAMAALDKEPQGGMFPFMVFADGSEEEEAPKSPATKLVEQREAMDKAALAAAAATSPKLTSAQPKSTSGEGESQVIINGMALDLSTLGVQAGDGTAEVMVIGDQGAMGDGGATFIAVAGFDGASLNAGTASPMTREDVDAMRKRLSLGTEDASILDLMFEDYLASWKEIDEGDFAELKAIPSEFGAPDQTTQPSAADIARRFELQRSITEQVVALDRAFFGNARAAFSGAVPARVVDRERTKRERDAYRAAAMRHLGMANLGGSSVATADIADVVRNATLSDAARTTLDPMLDEWDAAATEAFRARFDTQLSASRQRAEVERRIAQKSHDGNGNTTVRIAVAENDADFAALEEINKRAAAADKVTQQLNESTIDRMASALTDTNDRQSLLDAWDRTAWPSVFRDRRDIEPFIAKAFALADLSPESRTAITAIVEEHRREYRRICAEMIETNRKLESAAAPGDGPGNIDVRALQARQDTLNRLRFERSELNEKSLRRIRESLTPAQAEAVGNLPSRETNQGPRQFRIGG